MKEKEYEVVAEFEKDNCMYTLMQRKEQPTENEVKDYHKTITNLLYS